MTSGRLKLKKWGLGMKNMILIRVSGFVDAAKRLSTQLGYLEVCMYTVSMF